MYHCRLTVSWQRREAELLKLKQIKERKARDIAEDHLHEIRKKRREITQHINVEKKKEFDRLKVCSLADYYVKCLF